MDVQKCGICGEEFNKHSVRNTITEQGLTTLFETSKDRGDGKWENWQQQSPVICHASCRKRYIAYDNVAAALKRKILDSGDENDEDDNNNDDDDDNISREELQSTFDYATNCIFCGRSCGSENGIQHPQVKRKRSSCKVKEDTDFRKEIQESIMSCEENWSRDVRKRIEAVANLTAVGAVYHIACHLKFIERLPLKNVEAPPVSGYARGWHKLREHIENSEEGQYTLDDLRVIMECSPSDEYMKTGLMERFGDEIIFSNLSNRKTLVTLKTFRDKILYDFFENKKHPQVTKKNQCKVAKKAAQIVLKDLCAKRFIDYRTNPLTTESMNTLGDVIPETLKLFLSHVLENQKNHSDEYKDKEISIAHAIMAAARPNTFISPLQLASSVYIHLKTQSKILVTLLSKLGFGVSYSETLRYLTLQQDKSKLAEIIENAERFIWANLENAAINAGENAAAIYAIQSTNTINDEDYVSIEDEEINAATMNSEENAVTEIDEEQLCITNITENLPTMKRKEHGVNMHKERESILNGWKDVADI